MPKLKFYDVKKRKSFTTDKYKFVEKKNSRTKKKVCFVVAKAPSGIKAYRIVSKSFYKRKGRY